MASDSPPVAPALARAVRLGRARAFIWRFHTLALAHRLFAGVAGPALYRRRLFGFEISLDVSRSNVERLLALEGERFVSERRLVSRLMRPGMRVVDVGANIGYYLLLAESRIGAAGSVVCVEPEPRNLEALRHTIDANRLGNVRVVAAAAGDRGGHTGFRSGVNGMVADLGDTTVPLVRLDDVVPDGVDLLKIDVEGFEGRVLAGAERLLTECRPSLFVEVHPWILPFQDTADGILGLLERTCGPVELYERTPEADIRDRVAARYLGGGVRRVPDRDSLLAACRAGHRSEPFWIVRDRGGAASGKSMGQPRPGRRVL